VKPAPKAEVKPADQTPVIARVGALTLTQAQLDELTSAELTKLREELKQKIYEVQSQAVERFVTEGALEQRRAQTTHADLNALIEAEAFASIKDATEEEAKAFFDENRERLNGAQFEDVKPRIIAFLGDQKRREAFETYLGNLKKEMKVQVNLEPPRVQVESEGVGFTKGPQSAPITIVEFADFECGYCSRGGEVIKEVMKRYPNQVRLVYRDFPLSFHQNAESASIAARCAGEQGKYWEMHEHLFAHQQELNVENYLAWATELGLNIDAFKACSEKPEIAAAIRADFEAGSALGVTGTPAFFVNGVNLSGARPVEDFVRLIDSELARLNK
jgi:protein-disulfide isomerase